MNFVYENSIFEQELERMNGVKHGSTKPNKKRMDSYDNSKACADLRIYMYLESLLERQGQIYTTACQSTQISHRNEHMWSIKTNQEPTVKT